MGNGLRTSEDTEICEAGVGVLEGGSGGRSRVDKGERLRRARLSSRTSGELRDERREDREGLWTGERYFEAAGPEEAEETVERPPKVRRSSKRRSEGVRGEEEGAELDGGRGGVEERVVKSLGEKKASLWSSGRVRLTAGMGCSAYME